MNGRSVPARPAVSARFHVEIVRGDAVAFVGENGSAVVQDAVTQRVVPLIDGLRTSGEIAAELSAEIERWRVLDALGELAAAGLIVEAAGLPAPGAALWAELGVSEFRATEVLARSAVAIESLSAAPLDALYLALSDFGIAVSPQPELGSVRIVVCDDYLEPALAAVDWRARGTGQPWVPVKPVGVNVWVGPLFVPGSGPCWQCLADRLRRNRPVDAHLHQRTGRLEPLPAGRAKSHLAAQHAFSMTACALAGWFAGVGSPLADTLTILETVPLVRSSHAVRRRPQCHNCGDPSLSVPPVRAPELAGAPAPVVSRDGGERTESPEATFARHAHLISPVTGVVSAVVPSVRNASSPLRSYGAGHNAALSGDTLVAAAETLRAQSSGKGRSDAQARASALCEGLERYSGLYTGGEPRTRCSLLKLGDAGLDPRECMLFSEAQYNDRERWLASGRPFHVVPEAFDPAMELDWSPLWSLTADAVRYLPTSYLYYDYPRSAGPFIAWADSNGCAASETLIDACLHGLYELIERDSVAIWWYNRIRRPGIDLDALNDPWIDEPVRDFYARVGREVWLLDLTTDLGVPAAAALTRRLEGPTEEIVMGFGAHHDPVIAANRALTEMNQFLPAALDLHPDGPPEFMVSDQDTLRWWYTAHVDDQPYLTPLRSVPPTRLEPQEAPLESTSGARLRLVIELLERRGFEVLLLDQTRPDIGLPVAKMLVPGLRHFWARFAPGRLFDVPVAMGWLPEPTREEELNPIAMFL